MATSSTLVWSQWRWWQEDDDDQNPNFLVAEGRKVERYVAAVGTMMDRRRNTEPLLVPLCISTLSLFYLSCICISITSVCCILYFYRFCCISTVSALYFVFLPYLHCILYSYRGLAVRLTAISQYFPQNGFTFAFIICLQLTQSWKKVGT